MNTKIFGGLCILVLIAGISSLALEHSAYAQSTGKTSNVVIKKHVADKTQNYVKSNEIAKAAAKVLQDQLKKQHAK